MKHFFQNWTSSVNIITDENIDFPLHFHKTVELVLVTCGQIAINLNNNRYILNKNDIAIIFPGQLHSYETLSITSTLKIVIFDPSIVHMLSKDFLHCHPTNPVLRSGSIDKDIYLAFNRLHIDTTQTNFPAIHAWIQLILALIMPQLNINKNPDTGEADLVYRIIDYLSIHYTEHLSLDELAKELHVNKYYLSHAFSTKLYMSFTDYINRLRIDYAKNLLLTTDFNISYVGEQSGFETQRTFNRVFKKIVGTSPKEYRQNHI